MGRTARGTSSIPLASVSGDRLFSFSGKGYTGSAYTNSTAYIQAFVAETYTSSNQGSYINFGTTPLGSTSSAERMRIDPAGLVGIGTTTPAAVLHLSGNRSASAWGLNGINFRTATATFTDSSTAGSATVTNNMVNVFDIPTLAATNTAVTYTNAATLYIAGAPTAGTNVTLTNKAALVVAAGNVGIGTSAPVSAFSNSATNILDFGASKNVDTTGLVWKTATAANKYVAGFENTTNSAGAGGVVIRTANTTSSTYLLQLVANGTETASFTADGSAFKPGGGSFSATSDARAKKNIVSLNLGLDAITALNPVSFQYNGEYPSAPDNGKTYVGLIAQEVVGTPLEQYLISTDNATGLYRLDPSAISYALIGSVKELDIKVAVLPDFEDDSLMEKVRVFLEGIAQGIAHIGKVETNEVTTDKLCVGSVCVTEEQFMEMVQEHGTADTSKPSEEEEHVPEQEGEETTAPVPPEQAPTEEPAENETPPAETSADEVVL